MYSKYEDISPDASPPQKMPLLSSQEMRKVLDDVLEEPISPHDEEVEQDLSGVLGNLPDLEGDCSILNLGWNENLGWETEDAVEEEAKESGSAPSLESEVGESSKTIRTESPKKEISCWSKVKAQEKALPEPVPIQKGDLIEFLVEDKTWFLVEVTGRGKAGGKNRNYLNVKYSDGSEGGVFIDKHQWRIVKREEVQEEVRAECSVRLHRVTVGDPLLVHETVENVEDVPDIEIIDEEKLVSDSEHAGETSHPITIPFSKDRKRRKRRKQSLNLQKLEDVIETTSESVEKLTSQSQGDPASLLKKCDIIEYLVEEDDDEEEDTWFLVEVLGRGKAGGKNRNYLNVRYKDQSEGGVFIDKHQWRLVRRVDVTEGKL